MSQPERKLGTWPIFVIAVSAMTPLTVVAGALPLGYGEVKEKGIPVAYMLVAAVLGVFAVGLAAMARHVPNSGAFYAYASIGISRPVGVGTAFVALVAYNAMQIGLYGAFGVAAHNALSIFGIEISWIICALIGWALISVLGRLDIDLNARILTVLVCAEVLIVLIFDAAMLGNPSGGTITFDTLNPGLIATAGGVSLLVAAIAGMVGFEAPLVYAAEARDPRRTIARAIGYTLLVAAFLYGGTAWAMSVVAGPDNIVVIAGQHLDDLFFFLPDPYLPSVLIDLGRIFFATSLFAAMLAFHHTVARYALTVAREGVLPAALARTRGGVPVAASTAQSALAVVVLVIFAIAMWDPTTDLFFFGTVSGGLGVLVLMTIAAFAVVRFFRGGEHGETRWRRAVAPWIAAVFLSLVLLLTVAFFSVLLDTDNIAKVWSPILSFLAALVAGIIWGRKLRRERPDVYAVIGTGHPPLAPGESPPAVITDEPVTAPDSSPAGDGNTADAHPAVGGSVADSATGSQPDAAAPDRTAASSTDATEASPAADPDSTTDTTPADPHPADQATTDSATENDRNVAGDRVVDTQPAGGSGATAAGETISGSQGPGGISNSSEGTAEASRPAPAPRKRAPARTSSPRKTAVPAASEPVTGIPSTENGTIENGSAPGSGAVPDSSATSEGPAARPRAARRPAPRPRRPQPSDTAVPSESESPDER
ncbi:APC family permease [Actinoplanes subglobosus]|uniref:Amino acid permease n=1 Tax=Actinoplanes subglobosus TaxID=1547892 RepID=A0ABV8J8U4_9ACTN